MAFILVETNSGRKQLINTQYIGTVHPVDENQTRIDLEPIRSSILVNHSFDDIVSILEAK